MKTALELAKDHPAGQTQANGKAGDRPEVLEELDRILASRHFKSADRSKQFLRHVVLSRLDGHTDRLKERTIGADVFQRPAGYATGDDPVVRVQAGEVRRRLQQYYQETPPHGGVAIELPLGSYSPVFHNAPVAVVGHEHTPPAIQDEEQARRSTRPQRYLAPIVVAIVVALAIIALVRLHYPPVAKSALEMFWGPAIQSQQPILVCIANATTRPYDVLSQSGSPGAARTALVSPTADPLTAVNQKADEPPISPDKVPSSDAAVAFALSGLFGKLGKPTQLRIGAASTFADLRNSPAALIGGFNSRWTIQLVSNLHFIFTKDGDKYLIHEQVPGGRSWTPQLGRNGETVEDFAIVSRLIDSKTGQFAVTVAGIGPGGTQAAGEFVSTARYLEEGIASAPPDWENRNLEVVLQTTVTDSVAGPPHVIAIYSW